MAIDRHATCPYRAVPAEQLWRKSVAGVDPDNLQPMVNPKFRILADDRIATAGSCFAQHIAKHLQRSGYHYFITEPAHPVISPKIGRDFNYGTFSARFGNLYTTRQLLQLLRRAYGEFTPVEDVWLDGDRLVDPFRPLIQPGGFATRLEFDMDRQSHFSAVRRMVEEADVFIFTLGLTEAWEDIRDGAVFPVCPGCGNGEFSDEKFRFRNLSAAECIEDLGLALDFIRARNPSIRVVLTVSPVPLIATAEAQHVLTATTYSKSILRVVAGEVAAANDYVDYFPSYEIITGSYARGRYFADDLREVLPEGVAHVMRCFSQAFLGIDTPDAGNAPSPQRAIAAARPVSALINDIICDEETMITEAEVLEAD